MHELQLKNRRADPIIQRCGRRPVSRHANRAAAAVRGSRPAPARPVGTPKLVDRQSISMAATGPMSPCLNICSLDEGDYCRGCLRSRDEIAGWVRMTPDQQWRVIRATEERRSRRRLYQEIET